MDQKRIAIGVVVIVTALVSVGAAEPRTTKGVHGKLGSACLLDEHKINRLVSARRGGDRGCMTPMGRPGYYRVVAKGAEKTCACVAKAKPTLPRAANVSLHLQTGDSLPGQATFILVPEKPNFIKFVYFGLPLLEYRDGINGNGTVRIDVQDDVITLMPETVVFTSPSRRFLERIEHGNRTELVPGQHLAPIVFDRQTGQTVSNTTIRLKTVNWYYTEDNPLISTARVGGSIDLDAGEYNLTLNLDF